MICVLSGSLSKISSRIELYALLFIITIIIIVIIITII